jgi:PAS domain S-box-containing protein
MMKREEVHILIIDDEKIIRDGTEHVLKKEGYKVVTAKDGEEGLECLKSSTCHLLILDLMMPGIRGMDVLKLVQKQYPDLLVIVITGYATVGNAVEAMKIGAYDFIPKPFTPDQLRIVVRRAIDKLNLEQEMALLRREREKSLQDIANEKSRVKTIIHCMADGVIVTDRENRIVLTNPVASLILSTEGTDLIGKPLSFCVKDERLNRLVEGFFSSGEPQYSAISQEIMIKKDKEIFLLAHAAPVKNEEGDVLGSVIVFEDVTCLKELDRMKSDFVNMVSHELRTPLVTVSQQLSVILDGIAGEVSEKQRELLTRAKERNKELINMVKNLLDLSKIESGEIVQYKETMNVNVPIGKVIEMMLPQALEKGISLEFKPHEPLPFIDADVNNMEGVFTNLISNAVKYTNQGGKVMVRSRVKGGYVQIDVTDTGIGIAREDLAKIFDRFYRVKTEQTRKVIGSGLGLSIVKGVIEAHLGSIEVESEPGKGTTFSVSLPIKS